MSEIKYEPIAYFKSSHQQVYEAPRQAVLAEGSSGIIQLVGGFDPTCCEDLQGFERLWLIYDFHENDSWKAKVRPPRFSEEKRSVFSSRSPYRPNSIGMSCVRLDKVEGTKLYISEHDLLDATPILDIKPYLPYADSFPGVKTGWVKAIDPYEVFFKADVLEKILWLEDKTGLLLRNIIKNQLSYEPINSKAKRVKRKDDHFEFALRTWRFEFQIKEKSIHVFSVCGSYSQQDLDQEEDPHSDKQVHRDFLLKYSKGPTTIKEK